MTSSKSGITSVPTPRDSVARMTPYVPGEQSPDPDLIKLNTNESPYPPSQQVLKALRAIDEARVRKYPDPLCIALRDAVAKSTDLSRENIIVSNGSDEILKMVMEVYVQPGDAVGYLWPTYSLYPVFVEEFGAREVRLDWSETGTTQEEALLNAPRDLRVIYIANPNPPIGLAVKLAAIRQLAEERPKTLIVVDEAYITFGGETALPLVREGYGNVLVTRTFSKAYALAGMRVGLGIGVPALIDLFNRVKDSYNVSVAAQAAALAAWEDAAYTQDTSARICKTRERLKEKLRAIGFAVGDSQGNFVFARRADAVEILNHLRAHKVMVRYFKTPGLEDGLRISIGTDEQMRRMISLAQEGPTLKAAKR